MNINEIEQIMKESGIPLCPICGTPFGKRHSRQKTCGTEECKRLYHNKYLRERRERLIAEDREAFNRSHAMAQWKSRQKKKMQEQADRNYAKLQEHWEQVADFDRTVAEHGFNYGERQAEKTLASVPKIDVEAFMKERKKE